jgi:hypothetical protein
LRDLIVLDGFIIMEDFLAFCTSGKMTDSFSLFTQDSDELEKNHFSLMDTKQKGAVAWSDFALFYTCKIIASKNKVNIQFNKSIFVYMLSFILRLN